MNTRTLTKIIAALSFVAATPLASAQAQRSATPGGAYDWGNYVGVSIGDPDFGDLGAKAYVGQQFHPNIAWEASYLKFFEDEVRGPFGTSRADFWGLSGAAIGILPLQQGFSVFGKLGLVYGRARVRVNNFEVKDSDTNLLIGVGGRYQLTPRVAIRVEFEDFDQGDLFSAGVTYRF